MQPAGNRIRHSSIICSLALALGLIAPLAGAQELEKPAPRTALDVVSDADACKRARQDFVASGGLERASLASPNIDVTWYSLDLDLYEGFVIPPGATDRNMSGVVRVDARVVDVPLSQLVLDFGSTGSMTVSSVMENGTTPIPFTHANNALTMTLSSTIPVGGTVSVVISYSGLPRRTGFGSFVFGSLLPSEGSVQYAWSLSEPYGAREWWPCKDHPSDKADSVRVAITVPDGFTAVSQGLLRSVTSGGGRTTFEWASRYPITSYLVSVAASDYVKYTSTYTRPPALAALYGPLTLPMEHYHYNDFTSGFKKGWKDVESVFPVFEDWFGAYPFAAEKYGHAEFTFGGGMEHQTISSMGTSALTIVAHELAHQWFGDAISPAAWPHLWLNEGFATWSQLLYAEARPDSFPAGTYEALLSDYRRVARGAVGTVVLSDTLGTNMFGDLAYQKGAMVLRMLRGIVGDSTMKAIVHAYAEDPSTRYGNATTSDFQGIVAQVYGDPLSTFFDQWLYTGTGYPVYRISAEENDSLAGPGVLVTVEQLQTPQESNVAAFVMPVTIAVQTTAGEERFTVLNDLNWQVYHFDLADPAVSVTLDPDRYILSNESVTATVTPPTPVFISNFDARATGAGVELSWLVYADEALAGFRVLRAEAGGDLVPVHDGLLPREASSYRDDTVVPGGEYAYVLVAFGETGFEAYSQRVFVRTHAEMFALEQNHPNPFNPTTTIAFTLVERSDVQLAVYDAAGHRVVTLMDATADAGRTEVRWDGRDGAGNMVSSGTYFYRLKAGNQVASKKMVLLK